MKTRFYRAQVTEEELRLATRGTTPSGQPNIDYEATYPNDCPNGPWCKEGKSGKPILNIVQGKRIIHGDINALIVGPRKDGRFKKDTYPLERDGYQNPALPDRLQPFREFVSIFHDENAATQAFPYFFEHPELKHTLHGVRDAFMINYGSGGIGAEIIANRLQAGPMQDCLDCAYEEFFLSSFTVGDAAMLVDKPANLVTSQCQPEFTLDPVRYADEFKRSCIQPEKQRATEAYYPHDPANVHHSYIGDFVKFRNMHSGKEQHIFHLHNHQWLFNPNDDNSNYIDAQGIGPGSGYTYEIAYGGSGNRNKTVGDAIFHCHFYPHFAQGMWYMWRNHDIFEAGTRLAVSENETNFHKNPFELMHGEPAAKARALPDGEIVAGTPIPAIVPLPGKGMAPMPEPVHVTAKTNGFGSKAKLLKPFNEATRNPGYPFWIAGVTEHGDHGTSVGSRPTTPPLDMTSIPGIVDGWNGGLPRHALAGFSAGGEAEAKLDRFTAEKHLNKAMPIYFPEEGTQLEQLAMRFHAIRNHPTHKVNMSGVETPSYFFTNGAPPVPGAPFNDPCIDDKGRLLKTGGNGWFFGGKNGTYFDVKTTLPDGIEFGGDRPRVYKGANLQLDVVFNKIGYHYPQQRILTLWEDVGALLDQTRPPEPLVMRLNTFDCAMYAHTNLVPKDFYADDFQITTPTDVIGQHIHLPKWDLTSADGGANGWNYEDGTFSPGMVRERIHAINQWNHDNAAIAIPRPDGSNDPLTPLVHPYFNAEQIPRYQKSEKYCMKGWEEVGGNSHEFDKKYGKPGVCDWFGARTTLQRWFSDPLVNIGKEGNPRKRIHRGLGITFTHDHLGPSTHQQLGLYATMLTEPPGSEWRHNETGQLLYDTASRKDGGPTSWQAVITGKDGNQIDVDQDKYDDSHREFFLQFGDFQHAYVKDAYYGVNKDGVGWPLDDPGSEIYAKPTPDSFRQAVNPSFRKPAQPVFPDIIAYEPYCPGGKDVIDKEEELLPGSVYPDTDFRNGEFYDDSGRPKRPCAEAISADDIGMMVVNYRNEPIGARVYDPATQKQAIGRQGDLAFAMHNMERAWPALNTSAGLSPYPNLTFNMLGEDPFTPIMRAYSGDLVRVKIQGGAHEHEHNGSINSTAWIQGGSGFGEAPHSGWRNSQNTGLSEQFTFPVSITDYRSTTYLNDRMYTVNSSQDGMWNGVWGVLRSDNKLDASDRLVTLPTNPVPKVKVLPNVCPEDAKIRSYYVVAVLANHALDNSLGVTIPEKRNSEADADSSRLDTDGGTLVYNPRATTISIEIKNEDGSIKTQKFFGKGPLHDPTAILFVRKEDVDDNGKIKPGKPVEPLVLRVAAGDCIQITLHNRLPDGEENMPDLDGYTSVSGIIHRDTNTANGSVTSFNNNLLRPSNQIGLHPQLVHYNVQTSDGNNVGTNMISTIGPGGTIKYKWYAGYFEIRSPEKCPDLDDVEDTEEVYRQLSLFAQLSKAQNGLPTRSPGNLVTLDAFRKAVYTILGPQFLQTGVRSSEVTTLAERLVEAASQTGLFKRSGEHAVNVNKLGVADAITSLGGINNQTLFELISNNGIANNLALLQSQSDQAPLLDSRAYFDPLENLGTFEEVQADIDKLQATFSQTLISSGRIFLNYLSDLTTLNVKQELQLSTLANIDRDFPTELKKFISSDTSDISVLPELIQEQIAEISNDLAGQLAMSVYYEVSSEHPNPYQWRTRFFGDFNPELNQDNMHLVQLSEACRYVPVEFGGTNLTPPDRIKQGQKAAVGALVIEPEKSFWFETIDDDTIDRQNPGPRQINKRKTRATATVFYPADENYRFFRDLVLVHQKGLNLRYADDLGLDLNLAVANLAAEKEDAGEAPGQTAPEDAHDSGQMAINYGTEPMWFRFGLPPDAPFGKQGFGGVTNAWQAFSNKECCDNGGTAISADKLDAIGQPEPYVPIMAAYAGQEMRIRALMPTGVGRGSTVVLHGHGWARDPYLAEFTSGGYPNGGRRADWGLPSNCIGENALAMYLGGQESVTPQAHYDLAFPRAGGKRGIKGDFLWRDHAGFGITSGLWSLIRVEPVPIPSFPAAPMYLRSRCEA